jgi:hypothetical protein
MKPLNAKLKNELGSWDAVQEAINFLFIKTSLKLSAK